MDSINELHVNLDFETLVQNIILFNLNHSSPETLKFQTLEGLPGSSMSLTVREILWVLCCQSFIIALEYPQEVLCSEVETGKLKYLRVSKYTSNAKVDVPPFIAKSAQKLLGLRLEVSSSSDSASSHFSSDSMLSCSSFSLPLSETLRSACDISWSNGEPFGNT